MAALMMAVVTIYSLVHAILFSDIVHVLHLCEAEVFSRPTHTNTHRKRLWL